MIKGLHFKNYSVLRDFSLGWTRADLDQRDTASIGMDSIMGLIGKNSSGKSTVFEGLAYLRDIVKYGLTRASSMNRRGGFARLKSKGPDRDSEMVELEIIGQTPAGDYFAYRLVLADDHYKRPYIKEECLERWDDNSGPNCYIYQNVTLGRESELHYLEPSGELRSITLLDARVTALSFLGRVKELPFMSYVRDTISKIFIYRISQESRSLTKKEKGGHSNLREQGDNLENVLNFHKKQNPAAYEAWLATTLSKIYGEAADIENFRTDEMSTGERKFFEILLVLYGGYSLICLDEPDVSLYYKMVEMLLVELREHTLKFPESQIIFSTHNPGLLQGLKPEEVWIMERSRLEDKIKAHPATQDPVVRAMYNEGIDMGTLWYGGYLGDN